MPSKYNLGYDAGMERAMPAVIKLLDKLADARRDSAEWKEQHENLLAMFRTSENRAAQAEARAEAAGAEVARLNSWADSFTDQHLKERQTGDALVKECMQRAEQAEARAEQAEAVVKLADELCTAVDNASEDIGGTRPIATILAELGPAIDTAIEQGAQHG